ncbi:hypothetical protein IV203_028116 [Nitzschia inconspicua]|uniref:Uncharacterized protein n=1 Tax=Nitzschia inconspicua TaxID=303405 RepID=A0A9K3LXM7_9STRA|nr:hypothetical protein IV203_028116 [Nitzschia inconspicua]
MRLSVAAAAVLATSELTQPSIFDSTRVKFRIDKGIWNGPRHGDSILMNKHRPFFQQALQYNQPSSAIGASSKGNQLRNIEKAKECIPSSKQQQQEQEHHHNQDGEEQEEEADVGILSMCESYQYCIEHPHSSLGGICVDDKMLMARSKTRQLEDEDGKIFLYVVNEYVCAEGSPYTCTSCEVDMEAGDATVDCVLPVNCTDMASSCDEPLIVCVSFTLQGSARSNQMSSYGVCATINTTRDDEMYQFEYCLAYPDMVSCSLEIDGIECTSCTEESYDCRNTRLGRIGYELDTVDLEEEATLYFLYRALPCPERCNFCSSGDEETSVTSSNGTPKSCLGEKLALMVGNATSDFCEKMQLLVEEPCDCQDEEMPATPDRPVDTPSPTPVQTSSNQVGSEAKFYGLCSSCVAAVATALVGAFFSAIH